MASDITSTLQFITQPPSFNKYLKISLLSVTLLCLVIHGSIIIQTYLSYPTADNTYQKIDFEFPDVTICHSARRSSLRGSRFDSNIIGNESFRTIFNRHTNFWYVYHTNKTNFTTSETQHYRKYSRKSILKHLSKNVAYKRPEDYVIHCTYQGMECNYKNFTMAFDPNWFYCATFKPNVREMQEEDEQAGLRLVLYGADSSSIMKSYNEYMHFLEGFRVIIHPPNSYPNADSRVTFLEVGNRVDVAVTRKLRLNLNLSKQPCQPKRTNINLFNHNVFPKKYTYSTELCSKIERQNNYMKKCGCLSHKYPTGSTQTNQSLCFNVPDYPFTKEVLYKKINKKQVNLVFRNKTTLKKSIILWNNTYINWDQFRNKISCHDTVSKNMYVNQNHKLTVCPPPCQSITYKFNVFKRSWPSERLYSLKYVSHALNNIIKENCLDENQNHVQNALLKYNRTQMEKINKNFMFLTVYPQSLTTETIVQERSYEIGNLFSDFGGCLGLWIGWSASTLMWFIWELCAYCGMFKTEVAKERQRNNTDNCTNTENETKKCLQNGEELS